MPTSAWCAAVGSTRSASPRTGPITRLRETIEIVRYLLGGRTDGYRGEVFQVAPGAALNYQPLRSSVPIVLGTWGERTARALGSLVDEVKVGGSANPEVARRMRQWLPPNVGVCLGAVCVVDRDGEAARAKARRELELYLPVVQKLDGGPPDLDHFAFAGTPDDILRQVNTLRAAGVSRIEFGTPHGIDQPETGLRLLGEHVLPRIER